MVMLSMYHYTVNFTAEYGSFIIVPNAFLSLLYDGTYVYTLWCGCGGGVNVYGQVRVSISFLAHMFIALFIPSVLGVYSCPDMVNYYM